MVVSRIGWTLALTLALSTAGAQADSTPLLRVPPYRRRLVGIYDAQSGEPVPGVRVTDVLSGTSMATSRTGSVVLVFVPEGVRLLRLQKLGYEVQTLPISIVETDTASLTIMLRRVTELPAVVTSDSAPAAISAKMRGFETRRNMHAGGYYVTEDILRRNDGKLLANVLAANLPGLSLDRRSGNKSMVVRSPRCLDGTHAGPPAVYLDGVAVVGDAVEGRRARGSGAGVMNAAPFDIQLYAVEDLAAVEWYPDNALLPVDVPHDSGRCGSLLLWTRER
jgi:hypothetical protein